MPWYVDRSRIQAYHDCKRLRFLNFHWGGPGLERKTLGLPLLNGQQLHNGLAGLLTGGRVDEIVTLVGDDYRRIVDERGVLVEDPQAIEFLIAEQLALLEGLLRAWQRVRLPVVLDEYDVVSVELEQPWAIQGTDIIDMVRCDAVLRRKSDKVLFYLEFKSVSNPSDGWAQQWEHNSQLLANVRALETIYREPVGGVLIEGIVKGRRAVDKAMMSPFRGSIIQQSPITYGYKSRDYQTGAFHYDLVWSKSADKFATWEEMSMEKWLDHFTPADLEALFIPLPPIKPVLRDMERWERQTLAQERMVRDDVAEIARIVEGVAYGAHTIDDVEHALDARFPQNTNHCHRYFGHPCAFAHICFNQQVSDDPIGSGLYIARRPHHDIEPTE